MESSNTCSDLPPGFRFHPTDEELIIYYLRNQATSMPCPASIIPEVDIYKFDPWQLPEKAEFGEKEWYFFTPRDRKYPNGARPNRATVSGYWKATGTDKAIYSGSKYVGVKKALVFYKGRPPKGVKSDWIMHEYRLTDLIKKQTNKRPGSMRLDDWVLCRIYNKKNNIKTNNNLDKNLRDGSMLDDKTSTIGIINNEEQIMMEMKPMMMPRTNSLAHLVDLDYWGPLSHLLPDGQSYNHPNVFDHQYYQTPMDNAGGSDQKWKANGDQNHNWMKLEVNENNGTSHVFPTFSNVHNACEFQ